MNEAKFSLIYLAYDGIITKSVFDSQVVNPLGHLQKTGQVEISLIAFENFISFFRKYRLLRPKRAQIMQEQHLAVYFFPRLPGFWGLNLTIFLLRIFGLRWLKNKLKQRPLIFQGRGVKPAYLGIQIHQAVPRMKVIYDARAKEAEQYAYPGLQDERVVLSQLTTRQKKYFKTMLELETAVLKDADYVFSISSELTKALIPQIPHPTEITTIANGIDTSRFYFSPELRTRIRTQLGLTDKFCVVYSGSMHPSQLPGKTVRLFKYIFELDSSSFFLGLTYSSHKLLELLQQEQIPATHYLILTKPYTEIVDYLNAGDIGLGLREKNIYNQTSFPVKFAEYLASGLFPVVSEGSGDITQWVMRTGYGAIVSNPSDSELKHSAVELLQQKNQLQTLALKRQIAELAHEEFNQEKLTQRRLSIYHKLVNE